jgi:hypothetical protein
MEFKKKGNKLILQPDPVEFTPVMVTESIFRTQNAIRQNMKELSDAKLAAKVIGDEEKVKNKEFIAKTEDNIKNNEEFLKKLTKYGTWAEKIQVTKLRLRLEECQKEVLETFKYESDKMLSDEGNKAQRFYLYKSYLSRDPEIQENVSLSIVNKYLLMANEEECIVKDPF